MRRATLCIVTVLLIGGIVYIAIDAVNRANSTLRTLTQGIGTPDNPTRQEERAAELNLFYLLGLAVGITAGLGLSASICLSWKLAQSCRPVHRPNYS